MPGQSQPSRTYDRRTMLRRTTAAAGVGLVAGCGGSGSSTETEPQLGPSVSTLGTVATVRILPGQQVVIGEPTYLRFSVRDADERLVAVSLDAVQVRFLEGETLLEINERGQAVGLAVGTVQLAITVSGVTSAAQDIAVVQTRTRQRLRQDAAQLTTIRVPVTFAAIGSADATHSARVTIYEAGTDGQDLVVVVNRQQDGAHQVEAVVEHCPPGDWDLGVEYYDGVAALGTLAFLVFTAITAVVSTISLSTSDFCFIATELYGPGSPEVVLLRSWRDRSLLRHRAGPWLVARYYALSPRMIPLMRRSRLVRAAAGWLVGQVARRVER